jgi:hypothetical protein
MIQRMWDATIHLLTRTSPGRLLLLPIQVVLAAVTSPMAVGTFIALWPLAIVSGGWRPLLTSCVDLSRKSTGWYLGLLFLELSTLAALFVSWRPAFWVVFGALSLLGFLFGLVNQVRLLWRGESWVQYWLRRS